MPAARWPGIGATQTASEAVFENIITIDVGGTSADVSLVRDGDPTLTTDGTIGDFPLQLPIIDIHTIGAGGGSIARVDATGRLTVGPSSAGADPGPVCYGRGAVEPTVTDAHLVLGRIPSSLLDGEIRLDRAAAEHAIQACIADPLGLSLEAAAEGILAIVDANMAGAIRLVSIERGHDPRRFTLVAFGGPGHSTGWSWPACWAFRLSWCPAHTGCPVDVRAAQCGFAQRLRPDASLDRARLSG
jgi:N-methylhydantoinase A